eukprot:scaffold49713_cov19-Prasinocladus_malaysianus.AAC.1
MAVEAQQTFGECKGRKTGKRRNQDVIRTSPASAGLAAGTAASSGPMQPGPRAQPWHPAGHPLLGTFPHFLDRAESRLKTLILCGIRNLLKMFVPVADGQDENTAVRGNKAGIAHQHWESGLPNTS